MPETSNYELTDRLINLLGKNEKAPVCKRFFADYNTDNDCTVDYVRISMFPELGFTIIFGTKPSGKPGPLVCKHIQFYFNVKYFPVSCAGLEYSNYSANLPLGMTLEDTDKSIQEKLAMEPGWIVDDYKNVMPSVFSHSYYLEPHAVGFYLSKESRKLVGLSFDYSEYDPWTQPENPDLSSCIRFPVERVKKGD